MLLFIFMLMINKFMYYLPLNPPQKLLSHSEATVTNSQTIIIGTQKPVAKLKFSHLPPVMFDCALLSYTKSVKY